MDPSTKISLPPEKQHSPQNASALYSPKSKSEFDFVNSSSAIPNSIEQIGSMDMLLQHVTDAVVLIKADQTIMYANSAWESLTGYTLDRVRGLSYALLQPSSEQAAWQSIHSIVEHGQTWRGELLALRVDGSEYESSLTIAPMYNDGGKLIYFAVVSRDISKEKMYLRAQETFITDVSHELRTPLTNINFYLSLLAKGAPDQQERYLETLNRESRRLQKITEDMLLLSQLDMDRVEPSVETIPLAGLLTDIVASRIMLANAKQVSIHYRPDHDLTGDAEPISLESDKTLLAELLTQLLTNAITYTDVGGDVELEAGVFEKAGQMWCTISIRDNGFGVDRNEHELIFERFYRGTASHEMDISGTGLGLPLSRQIASRLGGKIEIESALQKGSTFTLSLPIVGPLSPHRLQNIAQHRHLLNL